MFIWFVIIFMKPLQSDDISCPQAFDCVNESTIVNNSNNLINDGYKSHSGSLSSMSADYIYCRGSFSCIEASSMLTGHSRCYGTNSCSNILNIKVKSAISGYILSYGVNAMIYATVSSPSEVVYCYGEQSCAYSVIVGAISIEGYGSYSLFHAYIDSINGSGSLSIHLYGYYSGFGANIKCRTGHNCTIHCASNGCINLHLDCNNNCFLQLTSFAYDTIIMNALLNDVLLYDSFNTAIQNDASCTFTFDNYAERYQGADIIGNSMNEGAICCRGYASCSEINNIHCINQDIICSGGTSCYRSAIQTNGNIFCGGYYSCQSARINTIRSVYCYGYLSCHSGAITKASNIYCSAHQSCKYSYISSNGSDLNIYLLGYQSGHNATVLCSATDECYIFCYGYRSCLNVELECNGICTLYCDEDSMCPNGWTSSPTQYPTDYPFKVSVITNYTILMECDECDVDEETINERVYKALIAYSNVHISGTQIVNDEVIVKLFIETDYEHVLDENIIQKDLQKELRDDYGDIIVYNDDHDEIDDGVYDKSGFESLFLSKRFITIIVCIIAVIVMLLILGLFLWKIKANRVTEDIKGKEETIQTESLENNDMGAVQATHDVENDVEMDNVSDKRDSDSELMYTISTHTNETIGTPKGVKCVRCEKIKPGKMYNGDDLFYCDECSMITITNGECSGQDGEQSTSNSDDMYMQHDEDIVETTKGDETQNEDKNEKTKGADCYDAQ